MTAAPGRTDRAGRANFGPDRRGPASPEAAEAALRDGLDLLRWWERTDAACAYRDRFPIVRSYNDSGTSFGFFDRARIGGRDVAVMGECEDLLFDRPKTSPAGVYVPQLREFVLRYLMRVSDFRRPTAYAGQAGRPAGGAVGLLNWCPDGAPRQEGFGFSQWSYRRPTGNVGAFPEARRYAIVDLRDLGDVYDWIMARVQIYDFTVRLRPAGPSGPQVLIPLEESSDLVLSRDFIQDETGPAEEPDGRRTVARFGLGYAFIQGPPGRAIAYGPGKFDAAFQLFRFRVYEDGETRVRLAFVANRPDRIAELPVAPLDWPVRLTNAATLGLAAPLLGPLADALGRLSAGLGRFDPVSTFVRLANAVTDGRAAERYCISRGQLERAFLAQHYMQHYEMMTGALQTWRRVPDWSDAWGLPEWVRTGVSS